MKRFRERLALKLAPWLIKPEANRLYVNTSLAGWTTTGTTSRNVNIIWKESA